jgi:Domain of unknown function (DUF3846)
MMSEPINGVAIYPDKRIVEVIVSGLSDYQAIVDGYIEPVDLTFGTMWVNEEFTYKFGPSDVNWIASDVAGMGGRHEFMLSYPILGPVLITGGTDPEGETLGITDVARRVIRAVGREAGMTYVKATS